MSNNEFITNLLREFENRLENCTRRSSGLSGIVAAVESTVAKAEGLGAGSAEDEDRGRARTARAFAIRGYMAAVMPWEKIHV